MVSFSRQLVCAALLAGLSAVPAIAQPTTAADPTRFEAEIQKFDESDRATPVRPGGVVFTGSSSIRLWTGLAEDFPGVRTLNRGFGGSEIGDAIRYLDRVVLRYKPSQVVFYSGDNDLNAGKTPTAVAADYRRFVEAIHAQLPQTRIVILSIKPSLARWALVDKMKEVNRSVQQMAAQQPVYLTFVDVFTPMLGGDGKPRPELYVQDGLHMTRAGYEIWRRALAPALEPSSGGQRYDKLSHKLPAGNSASER